MTCGFSTGAISASVDPVLSDSRTTVADVPLSDTEFVSPSSGCEFSVEGAFGVAVGGGAGKGEPADDAEESRDAVVEAFCKVKALGPPQNDESGPEKLWPERSLPEESVSEAYEPERLEPVESEPEPAEGVTKPAPEECGSVPASIAPLLSATPRPFVGLALGNGGEGTGAWGNITAASVFVVAAIVDTAAVDPEIVDTAVGAGVNADEEVRFPVFGAVLAVVAAGVSGVGAGSVGNGELPAHVPGEIGTEPSCGFGAGSCEV